MSEATPADAPVDAGTIVLSYLAALPAPDREALVGLYQAIGGVWPPTPGSH